jgi:predicted adenine nucleotide alpha hydrolase (AANH) superfamily ATPase
MVKSGIELTLFFYNPNIHPKKEYEIRKNENKRFAEKLGIEFIDADYDVQNWFSKTKGMEYEPERGKRCTTCFDMRFERTALYAYEHDFQAITSSLGISRWKDMDQINMSGSLAASKYEGIIYWTYNWRKSGGSSNMYTISKREKFYKQEFCGCIYSLRDTDNWRAQNNRPKISIGSEYYGDEA